MGGTQDQGTRDRLARTGLAGVDEPLTSEGPGDQSAPGGSADDRTLASARTMAAAGDGSSVSGASRSAGHCATADSGAATIGAAATALPPSSQSRVTGPGGDTLDSSGHVTPEAEGRYSMKGEHARGGQARVLVALDRHTGRDVAWKEILPEGRPGSVPTGGTAGLEGRFLREARITARLQHPNIVPVHEIGRRHSGELYYTMRLVRGATLAQRLAACRGLADRLELLGAFWDVCNAVAFAHTQGVVHRDLKPSNCMVGEFGETVVLDWGLAKVRGKADPRGKDLERHVSEVFAFDPERTVAGSALGTPAYMSPEQARGDVVAMDERSDVWGLGAVLYELLTGVPPCEGQTLEETLARAREGAVDPVLTRCPEAPAELAAIAQKALQRDPSRRYASARELAAEVSAYMTGARVGAHDYSAWELLRRFATRHRASLVAGVATLMVIIGALVLVSVAYRQESASRVREQRTRLESQYHLAQAHAQRAELLLGERKLLPARIYALASLLSNPAYPGGPGYDPGFAARVPASYWLQVRAASDHYLAGFRSVKRLHRSLEHGARVAQVAFSPDGRLLVTADGAGRVRLLKVPELEEVWRRKVHDQATCVAFSPDGQRVASAGVDGTVAIHTLGRTGPPLVVSVGHAVPALAYSPEGTLLATGDAKYRVRLWHTRDGAPRGSLLGHTGQVWGVAFSPDGKWLASGSWDKTARLWDVATRQPGPVLRGHRDAVYQVSFSPDGKLLATAGYDRTVRLWEVPSGTLRATLRTDDAVYGVEFLPGGQVVAGGGTDGMVRLWNVATGALLTALQAHRECVPGLAFSADGRLLATGGWDQVVRLWERTAGDGLLRLGHPEPAYGISLTPDGKTVVTGSWDGKVRVWRLADGRLLRTLAGHTDGIWWTSVSDHGQRAISAGNDRVAQVWEVATGRRLARLEGHRGAVLAADLSPDGRLAATGSWDRTLRLWDVDTGRELALHRLDSQIRAVDFSADGKLVAAAGDAGVVHLVDLASRRVLTPLKVHTGILSGLAFAPDSRTLAVGGVRGFAATWDVEARRELRRFTGHRQWVNRVKLTRDGRYLVTGGDDAMAVVWDVATGQPLLRLGAPAAVQVFAISSRDGVLLISEGSSVVVYPIRLPLQVDDAASLLKTAQAEAGLVLDGFGLRRADPPGAAAPQATTRALPIGDAGPPAALATPVAADAGPRAAVATPVAADAGPPGPPR